MRHLLQWFFSLGMKKDIRNIIRKLNNEDVERIRNTSKEDLIIFHRTLGLYLRNQFRTRHYLCLLSRCHALIEERKKPLSFDSLSSIALELIWDAIRTGEVNDAKRK